MVSHSDLLSSILLTFSLQLNISSIALARLVARQVRLKVQGLATSRVSGEFTWASLSMAAGSKHSPTTATVGETSDHLREASTALSRAEIRQLAEEAPGALSEQARQIRVLQKAERDLVVVSALDSLVSSQPRTDVSS